MNPHDTAGQQRSWWAADGEPAAFWAQKPAVVHMATLRGRSGILGDSLEEDLLEMPPRNPASQEPSLVVHLLQDPGSHPLAVHNEASPGFSSPCPENAAQEDVGPGSSLHGPHSAHGLSGPNPSLHRASGPAHIKLIPKMQGGSTRKPVCVLMLGPGDLSPNSIAV